MVKADEHVTTGRLGRHRRVILAATAAARARVRAGMGRMAAAEAATRGDLEAYRGVVLRRLLLGRARRVNPGSQSGGVR